MSECRGYEELLAQYVADGEPARHEHRALRRHLAACPACQDALVALRSVEQALWEWPLCPAPEGLPLRILAAIERQVPVAAWRPLPWSVWVPALTLLAAMLLALALAPAPGPAPAVPWLDPSVEIAAQVRLPDDPAVLWALWVGCSIVLFGIGITMALVQGRLPNGEELAHWRHRVSDTAHRLSRLAGR